MIKETLIVIVLIFISVISEENHDNIVSSLVDGTQQKINITCLCTEDERCDSNTRTCRLTQPEHVCYQSWTQYIYDNKIQVTAGCIYNEYFFTQLLCNINQTNRYIVCCSDRNYCNDRDRFATEIHETFTRKNKSKSDYSSIRIIIIIIGIILLFSFICLLLIIYINKKKRKTENENSVQCASFKSGSKNSISTGRSDSYPDEISKLSDESRVRLLKRSFANEVTLEKKIGVGAYGTVYRGIWHKDPIAVKIRLSNEEVSWRREVDIYLNFRLNHENILRFIAADNIDYSHGIQLWIGTEYHENGSIYDYLMNHTITISIMINMMYTIADGLFYLHKSIEATDGKPALAHRDLKTKNILVKKDLSCCIADLGLAVSEICHKTNGIRTNYEKHCNIDMNSNHRVGTIRYMAPEIIDKTFNHTNFESYKATDLYALGLVYWEILRRCQTTPEENDADIYQLPYADIIPHNPTIEQMHEVVCIKKVRPACSTRWKNHSIFSFIYDSCSELWAENPACRPSSCVIKDLLRDYRKQ